MDLYNVRDLEMPKDEDMVNSELQEPVNDQEEHHCIQDGNSDGVNSDIEEDYIHDDLPENMDKTLKNKLKIAEMKVNKDDLNSNIDSRYLDSRDNFDQSNGVIFSEPDSKIESRYLNDYSVHSNIDSDY